jgi:uncharacterized membrane protein
MRKSTISILIIILVSFIMGVYLYPHMPAEMASHWNVEGQVDGYMSKFWGLFLMPFISVAMFLLFILIPAIDPWKKNIDKFRKYFDRFIIIMMSFLFYINLLSIFWSTGLRFNIIQMMSPAFGILLYYTGVLTGKAKRNWFIGIRTPWTISNDKVWDKTHKIGGKLFKIAGILAFFGVLFPDYAILLILLPAVFFSLYAIIYSYLEYKKLKV